jgi:acetyl/propionyl-CoA carboxylase alpha subunit
MVLGMDLVREQIKVAQGEKLGLKQEDVHPEGASMEFRVYAEAPDQGFCPDAVRVRRLDLPSGPGVRCEFGVRSGGVVPVYYDPMIGKIVVWAPNRAGAIERARRALRECVLEGIKTTLPFHRWLLDQEPFVQGDFDTGFLSRHFKQADPVDQVQAEEDAAVLAAVFARIDAARPVLNAPSGDGFGPSDRRPMTTADATTTSRWRDALQSHRARPGEGR